MATTDKYDRQTRLWGSNGQRLLGEATIIMLGTSSAGTECLKNLVLPGAGHFMIVDDKKVDARDCGNDFFVTQDKIGTCKAKVIAELMKEMNPDVKTGNYMDMAVAEFIERTDMILDAQLVILCEAGDGLASKVGDLCYSRNIPLLLIRQYGLLGYIRIQKAEDCIVEPKVAQRKIKDLRIHDPFPELKEFANSIDFKDAEKVDDALHQHTPYAVILI